MTVRSDYKKATKALWAILLSTLLITCAGCKESKKIYTVGIASWDVSDNRTLEGFKSGMAERGYVEGGNVRYVYELIPDGKYYNEQYIDSRLKVLLTHDPDLIVTMGLEVSLAAQSLTEGSGMAVLFSGNLDPVGAGLVDSILRPGGSVTGVRFANSIPKALQWLKTISGEKRIYVPFDPDDAVSNECLGFLDEAARQIDVELVRVEVFSVEEAVDAIENLPPDAGAVYRIPSPCLDPRSIDLTRAAIRRRIAMCSPHRLDDEILATFSNDEFGSGKMLARLAQQIDMGFKPSDLPVETVEAYLTLNLKTAEKIGLDIPNDVLTQAREIIH